MKKTKMKIMSLLLSMVLFLFVPFLNLQAASNHPARLVDQAELLTAEEQQQIQAKPQKQGGQVGLKKRLYHVR